MTDLDRELPRVYTPSEIKAIRERVAFLYAGESRKTVCEDVYSLIEHIEALTEMLKKCEGVGSDMCDSLCPICGKYVGAQLRGEADKDFPGHTPADCRLAAAIEGEK